MLNTNQPGLREILKNPDQFTSCTSTITSEDLYKYFYLALHPDNNVTNYNIYSKSAKRDKKVISIFDVYVDSFQTVDYTIDDFNNILEKYGNLLIKINNSISK